MTAFTSHAADAELVGKFDLRRLVDEQFLPWTVQHRADGTTVVHVVAAAPLAINRLAEIAAQVEADEAELHIDTDLNLAQTMLDLRRDEIVGAAVSGLHDNHPEFSARPTWVPWQRTVLVVAVIATAGLLVVAPRITAIIMLIGLNLAFFGGTMFKVVTSLIGHRQLRDGEPAVVAELTGDLPTYTILVPAFHEAEVIGQIVEHLATLDYPTDRLQILVLLEQGDADTITAFEAARPPGHIRKVICPPASPQTKPKACNIGLELARGEFLVVYDAEDLPERDQLRAVLDQFRRSPDEVACIQARLNYYNADDNILTRVFTLEYSYWFDYMLPGLGHMHLPIPLGGTSNHFRVSTLRAMGGWDAFNVTEDADLGLRAASMGFRVDSTASTTWEEACSQWRPWVRQRTRWIKGYLLTFLVHMRRPVHFARTAGWRGSAGLILLVGGTPATFLAAPFVWAVWIYTFLGGSLSWLEQVPWSKWLFIANFVVCNGSMVALHALGTRRRRRGDLAWYALLLPIYWVLHSIAAWRAVWQLFARPSEWEKTPHGLRTE
jgi:glycosyltransferase XagB